MPHPLMICAVGPRDVRAAEVVLGRCEEGCGGEVERKCLR